MQNINLFMSCNDAYAPHLCAALTSALDNSNSEFRISILNQNLSELSKQNIAKCARGADVDFVGVDVARFKGFDMKLAHLSIEACFRYLIAEIAADADKAVYLDCDVIVLGDLAELSSEDIGGKYAAAVEDYVRKSHVRALGLKDYFNSGVLLLNLKKMRADNMAKKLFEETRRLGDRAKYLDQDVLNSTFRGAVKFLPPKWNASAPLFRKEVDSMFAQKDLDEALYSPCAVHFTGPDKPWKIPCGATAHPYAPAYLHYLSRTPYAACVEKFKAAFNPRKNFAQYWARHPGFFLRPRYWQMRKIYEKNLAKFPY